MVAIKRIVSADELKAARQAAEGKNITVCLGPADGSTFKFTDGSRLSLATVEHTRMLYRPGEAPEPSDCIKNFLTFCGLSHKI